jgi:hypothetical protein
MSDTEYGDRVVADEAVQAAIQTLHEAGVTPQMFDELMKQLASEGVLG